MKIAATYLGAFLALCLCGCAPSVRGGSAPAEVGVDPALLVEEGEVERTLFAEELNVVLLAMTRLPTGVYYRDIEEGSGASAQSGREVLVTYVAYLADGTEVDRTRAGQRPLRFTVGDGQVIRGWDLGIRGMKKGGTRQIVVPSKYGYGARGRGAVPANAVMVFVIRLDGVQ